MLFFQISGQMDDVLDCVRDICQCRDFCGHFRCFLVRTKRFSSQLTFILADFHNFWGFLSTSLPNYKAALTKNVSIPPI